jgi:PHB/PHA accumulation regulator DNA-binding domain
LLAGLSFRQHPDYGSRIELRNAIGLEERNGQVIQSLIVEHAPSVGIFAMIENVRADPILIKRYGGRRLYNTATLTYATLDDLANMVLQHQPFVVRDADTGGDITREILDQILH